MNQKLASPMRPLRRLTVALDPGSPGRVPSTPMTPPGRHVRGGLRPAWLTVPMGLLLATGAWAGPASPQTRPSRPARPRRPPQTRPSRPARPPRPAPPPQTRPARPSRPEPTVEATVDGDPIVKLIPKDAIPPVDDPHMVSAAEGAAFMRDDEMVLGVFDGHEARAYSTWHLDRHEVVNDRLSDTPIAATW